MFSPINSLCGFDNDIFHSWMWLGRENSGWALRPMKIKFGSFHQTCESSRFLNTWIMTTSNNVSSPPAIFPPSCNRTQELIFLVAYVVIGAVMLIGNAFVSLVFILTSKLRRNYMNIFLLSLSISDMLMALLVIPFYTVHCFGDCPHSLTHFCWLLRKARDFALGATTLNICAITYDRYLAILRPLKYNAKMTKFRVILILAVVWMIPVVVAATRNAWYHSTEEENKRHLTVVKLFDVAIIITPVIIFQVAILVVHIKIIRILGRRKAGPRSGSRSSSNNFSESSVDVLRLRKGTTSCVFVVLSFVACWLPKTVHNFSYVVDPPDPVLSSPLFFRICFLFLFIQSSLNPFIYTLYRSRFRKASRALLLRCCRSR